MWIMVIQSCDQVVGSCLSHAADGSHEFHPTTAGPHLGCSLPCSWPTVWIFLQQLKNETLALPTHFREFRMMDKGDFTVNCLIEYSGLAATFKWQMTTENEVQQDTGTKDVKLGSILLSPDDFRSCIARSSAKVAHLCII